MRMVMVVMAMKMMMMIITMMPHWLLPQIKTKAKARPAVSEFNQCSKSEIQATIQTTIALGV